MRKAGVLLHLSSLPRDPGRGVLGEPAERFVEWLQAAGFRAWQMLPVHPTAGEDSPFSSLSLFALDPRWIDVDRLARQVGIEPPAAGPLEPAARAEFLRAAGAAAPGEGLPNSNLEEAGDGLGDWALYRVLCRRHGPQPRDWPAALRRRDPAALEEVAAGAASEVAHEQFLQGVLRSQWHGLREYAGAADCELIGDLPLYPAPSACDVWAHPKLFAVGDDLVPQRRSGVPPDRFSDEGQLWGHPVYDWKASAETEHAWWRARLRVALTHFDRVRLDHFRGLESYWEVPAGAESPAEGRWVAGPGAPLLDALQQECGSPLLPVIAEDLGVITPEVEALRDQFDLPGMKILQFAFDEDDSTHLPHRHPRNSVVYTGTHDNDTTVGWYGTLDEVGRRRFREYSGSDGTAPHRDLVRLALTSPADLAILPFQDLLGLDPTARMNRPGTVHGNWGWRLARPGTTDLAQRLRRQIEASGRCEVAATDAGS